MADQLQHGKIIEIVDFHKCKKITIAPDGPTKEFARFNAGQYVILNIEVDGKLRPRFHTIASSPTEAKNKYSFFIKYYEDGYTSKYVYENWEVGTKVSLSLPMGNLYIKEDDCRNVIACCHGNSLVPFLSMAWAIAHKELDINLTILHGVDYEKDLIFKPDLLEIIDQTNGKFKLVNLVSKEPSDHWKEGIVDANEIRLASGGKEFLLLVSGNQEFYDHMDKVAHELGIPKNRYRKDRDEKDLYSK